MDAVETADRIQETAEETKSADERFRKNAAIVIGVLAMLLAIAGLGGDEANKETVNSNILASDTWAFFQAKNVRRTANRVAAEQMEVLLITHPDLPAEARADIERRRDRFRSEAARMESEPESGDGMRELEPKARAFEARRDRAQQQDPNFDYSQALLQIAIVLGSVSIVAASRWLLWVGIGLGLLATILLVNGFVLFFTLPFG